MGPRGSTRKPGIRARIRGDEDRGPALSTEWRADARVTYVAGAAGFQPDRDPPGWEVVP